MNIGLTGLATMQGSANVGTSGKPVRVFDVICSSTGNVCSLYNGTSVSAPLIIEVGRTSLVFDFHSNVGIRFANGCHMNATGGTASVNYITEF